MAGTPKVWSKFSVKTKNGTVLNLRIVDMPRNLSDEVIDLYLNYFVKEEKVFLAAGVPNSAEAMEELQELMLKGADDDVLHIAVCYIDNGDGQINDIVGASMMALISHDDADSKLDHETKEMKKLFEIIHCLETYFDEMDELDLDPCFSDRGLFVCPEYRGLGIAQEFLKVRRKICKAHGIPINGAWMTAYGTQKAAKRSGWETVCEVDYEELGKQVGVTFSKDPPTAAKFMIARIQ